LKKNCCSECKQIDGQIQCNLFYNVLLCIECNLLAKYKVIAKIQLKRKYFLTNNDLKDTPFKRFYNKDYCSNSDAKKAIFKKYQNIENFNKASIHFYLKQTNKFLNKYNNEMEFIYKILQIQNKYLKLCHVMNIIHILNRYTENQYNKYLNSRYNETALNNVIMYTIQLVYINKYTFEDTKSISYIDFEYILLYSTLDINQSIFRNKYNFINTFKHFDINCVTLKYKKLFNRKQECTSILKAKYDNIFIHYPYLTIMYSNVYTSYLYDYILNGNVIGTKHEFIHQCIQRDITMYNTKNKWLT
jgi:hypothetical protein